MPKRSEYNVENIDNEPKPFCTSEFMYNLYVTGNMDKLRFHLRDIRRPRRWKLLEYVRYEAKDMLAAWRLAEMIVMGDWEHRPASDKASIKQHRREMKNNDKN